MGQPVHVQVMCYDEVPSIERVNRWLDGLGLRRLMDVAPVIGGARLPVNSYCAIYDDLPLGEFLRQLRSIVWKDPERVYLCVQEGHSKPWVKAINQLPVSVAV